MIKTSPAEPFSIQPQRKWEESRKRLDEQVKRNAKILLNNVSLKMTGREIPLKYTNLKAPATNNFVSAITLLNREVHSRLNKDRKDCSIEDFERILNSFEEILHCLVKKIKKAQNEYKKT